MNWRWPATKRNGLSPWYVVLWRLPFVLMLYPLLACAFLLVAAGFGINEAVRFWRDVT